MVAYRRLEPPHVVVGLLLQGDLDIGDHPVVGVVGQEGGVAPDHAPLLQTPDAAQALLRVCKEIFAVVRMK